MQNGLLGKALCHSLSPEIHRLFGDDSYCLYEKAPEELEQFLKYGDFTGLNVTVPYKIPAAGYCHELSALAKRLGSVNTVIRRPDGTLYGHNTDYAGFAYMLRESGAQVRDRKVLVLGTGGASKAVCAVLRDAGARVVCISRHGENNYGTVANHRDAYALVNATPVGMYPDNGQAPVDLRCLPSLRHVLDVIYNPLNTRLLLQAQDLGLETQNGLTMLVAQGLESARLFSGKALEHIDIPEICRKIQGKNIVLVGMPGSGKSTLGARLAEYTGRQLRDTDLIIEKEQGLSPAEIITQHGEGAFRKTEAQVIRRLGKEHNLVIVTGGGAVTTEENRYALRQNGTVIWVKRNLGALATECRPLSRGNPEMLYRARAPLYDRFSHVSIDNNGAIEDALKQIQEVIK